jgi:hypothetical protein
MQMSLCALLFCTVCFSQKPSWPPLLGAAVAVFAGALTRYETWFLIPFVALFFLIKGRSIPKTFAFILLAAIGPALWLAHNRWQFGDALYFYRGPWSALAIQGNQSYPGKGNWWLAARYYLEAAHLAAGWPALLIAIAGLAWRRTVWPAFLLLLPAVFYVWSIHSSGTPLFVPTLTPFSYYNTRYAVMLLPLIALGAGAAGQTGKWIAVAVIIAALAPLSLQSPVTWRESDVNSRGRRQWTEEAAKTLQASWKPHETIITSFGDLTGIFRQAGIPLRSTITGDNDAEFDLTLARPDVHLRSTWAVVQGGDAVQTMIDRVGLRGPRYHLVQRIMVKDAPVIEIYRIEPRDLPIRAQ